MVASVGHSIVLSALVCLLILAAVRDFASFRIPNWISAAVVLLYPVHVLLSPQPVDWTGGLMVGAAVLLVGFLFFMLRALGGGDAKLMAAVALWGGFAHFGGFILVTLAASVVVALVVAVRTAMAMPVDADGANGAPAGRRSLGFVLTGLWHVPLTKLTIPYGVAIAAGGIYVALNLITVR